MFKVYKVVKEEHGLFFSSNVRGPARLQYTVGKRTLNEYSPIMVFVTIEDARYFALEFEGVKIMEGYSDTNPFRIDEITHWLLDPRTHSFDEKILRKFWGIADDRQGLKINQTFTTIMTSPLCFGVYDFTPTNFVKNSYWK